MRLAIFLDQLFWRSGGVLSTNEAYALFFKRMATHFEQVIFIGREAPEPGCASFNLNHPRISFCPIPYYENLYQFWRVHPRFYLDIRHIIGDAAKDWDAVLAHGPNPVGQMIAWQCESRGIPAIPVVRQNLVKMMGAHRGAKRVAATLAAWALEQNFKRLARRRSTLAVGMEMAQIYRRVSEKVHTYMPCLIDDAQFQSFSSSPPSSDRTRIIVVGRLSSEKGHRYLLKALSLLKSSGLICHLDVVGSGPLEEGLRRLAVELTLQQQIAFHGYVGFGPELFQLYRQAGVTVLPSLTEGLPQIINESLAIGLPTIATNVGGVPWFLKHEETALLVPPADATALASAIERLVLDGPLCSRLSVNGRRLMAKNTLEANQEIVMKVIRDEIYGSKSRLPLCA